MIIKKGVSISSGIAIGRAYPVDRTKIFVRGHKVNNPLYEVERLLSTVNTITEIFNKLKTEDSSDNLNSDIYDAYMLILEDELFIGKAKDIIVTESINAEYALKRVRDHLINTMLASKNEYIKERIYDIEHIYQLIQRELACYSSQSFEGLKEDDIVISHDLNTTDISQLIKKQVKAFATDIGGKTSHNSLIAKSAGLLGIVALGSVYKDVSLGDTVIIDGFLSLVIIKPTEEVIEKYKRKKADYEELLKQPNNETSCITSDKRSIRLFANIESNEDIAKVRSNNLLGVHLYRTEFLFISNPNLTEDDQFAIYQEASIGLKDKFVVLRIYDLGGDKGSVKNYVRESNPVLGLRAIRFCMKNLPFFKEQLRAILRASAKHKNIKILIPMITSVDELISVKRVIDDVKLELKSAGKPFDNGIKVGVMIELPSVAISIDKFIPHADFFSLGTNDLVQYTLGVDRENSLVEEFYTPLNHSIITLLSDVYIKLSKAKKDLVICGELAGDYRFFPILLGMGYRDFSINPNSALAIQQFAKKLHTKECKLLYKDIQSAETVEEADKILTEFLSTRFSSLFV